MTAKERQKSYRNRNRERINQDRREWYQNNKDKVIERNRLSVQRRKEKVKESRKRYYAQNKEKIKARYRLYYAKKKRIAMNIYFKRKLTRFLNWILYYSDDIKNTIALYNDIRDIKARLNKLEKAEEERVYKDKNKDIWGDHA